jgi:hypothetical protein
MASSSPLSIVKDRFGDKAKLVEAVKAFTSDELWVSRTRADRGHGKGLEHVSNAKLLRLHRTFSEVKDRFGTRAKLIDAVLEIAKRTKDAGFRKRLEAYPVPRLYDLYNSSAKRAGVVTAPAPSAATEGAAPKAVKKAAAKPAAAKAAAKPAAKKAAAKKPAAKKPARRTATAKKK